MVRSREGERIEERAPSNVSPIVVNIELYGVVRDLIRDRTLELRLDEGQGATFRMVLESLAQTYGPALRDRLFDRHGPASFVKVFAEGRLVTDLDRPLPDADGQAIRIIVFAAAGGG